MGLFFKKIKILIFVIHKQGKIVHGTPAAYGFKKQAWCSGTPLQHEDADLH